MNVFNLTPSFGAQIFVTPSLVLGLDGDDPPFAPFLSRVERGCGRMTSETNSDTLARMTPRPA